MGLLSFLKEKFSKKKKDNQIVKEEKKEVDSNLEKVEEKKEEEVEQKYIAGLDKSREGFSKRLKKLARANKVVNNAYFDNITLIIICKNQIYGT